MHLTFTVHINRTARKAILFALVVLVMLSVFLSSLAWFNKGDQAVQGVSVGNTDISKVSQEEGEVLIKEKINEFTSSDVDIKTKEGAIITASPRTIGVEFDADATIEQAYAIGRKGNIAKKLLEQARALIVGINQPVQVAINEERFNSFINTSLSQVHNPAQNASYEYNSEEEEFEFAPSKKGKIIDVYELRHQLTQRSKLLSRDPILLEQRTDEPLVVNEEQTKEARARVEEILENMPYTINTGDNESWKIEKDDIVSWIEFTAIEQANGHKLKASISREKIEEYLVQLAPGLHKEPIDAQFTVEGGRVQAFSLERPGRNLDAEQSATEIRNAIESTQDEATLVFDTIDPEITSENVDNLGITSLLGKGESNYAGSPNNRIHNIKVGSDKYQGMLLEPGEEFSFNQNLGPVNAAAGYLPELVILQDRTVPQYGGGLCQVSTTVFRAAVNAGLEITQRSAHSFHVQYYGTPGFDATIYPPNPDLRFRNNTPGHILIQYKIIGTRLIFEIYGQDDGRRVEVDGPHVYDRQANGAMKAWLKQTVYDKDDDIIEEQTFYSSYRSPNLYPVQRNPFE